MSSTVSVRPVESKKEYNDFLLLPWDLHSDDPHWVSPLLLSVKQSLDTKKNPFYQHATLQLWNAYRGNKCIGRIAGVVDQRHNEFHNEQTGFWGFFECENSPETAKALFQVVEKWALSKGMTTLRGPMNPSSNHECGLQISAFDTKPYIMMTQNPAYYPELVEKAGYAKAKDLYAWMLDRRQHKFEEKLVVRAKQMMQAEGITIRPIDMKNYDQEIDRMLEIYNDAWEKNWGFVPMTEAEFRLMANEMKSIVVPDIIFIVEVKGESAGFSVMLPDLNQVMAKIPSGRLFPTGLLKLLWHTKVKKSVDQGRIITLGVKKKFRHLGLASLMYLRYYEVAPSIGYPRAECSWTLEDNAAINQGMRMMNADLYKTYRIYDKPLS